MNREHIGSSLDSMLEDDGTLNEVTHKAALRVVAWQIREEMETRHLSKAEFARRLGTSRSQVERLINGEGEDLKISTLERAADVLGRKLIVELA